MALVKVKVIGPFEVCGIAPGDEGEIDDTEVLVRPLVKARAIELVPEPKPAKKSASKKKGDA